VGEHAEHAEACKPGEGTARLPTDFARILFTLSRKGSQRFSRGLSLAANTCIHASNRIFPTPKPATRSDFRYGLEYFGTGSVKSDFVALGGHQQQPEGQYEKSVFHVGVPPAQVP